MTALLAFMPEEALILLPIALGLLLVLRLINPGSAFLLLICAIGFYAFMPLIGEGLSILPLWALAILMVWVGYTLLRNLAAMMLGKGVADHLLGNLLTFLLIGPIRFLFSMIRSFFRGNRI